MRPDPLHPPARSGWSTRLKELAEHPVVRWLAVGVAFLGVNSIFLFFLIGCLGLTVGTGSLISAELCTLLRFFINQHWVFRRKEGGWRRLWQYHVANLLSLAVWWLAANILAHSGLHYLIAGALAVGFSTGFSMASSFLWVWRKERHPVAPLRRIVAGVILLRADGAALLQLRDNKPTIQDPGIWVVPGGHIEPGETAQAGACREFLEETCYRCAQPRPLASFHSTELGYAGDFDLVFFWDDFDGAQRIECREGQALEFVERANAAQLPCRDYLTVVWDLALTARDNIGRPG
jgi:8-oxo-dGTP pyrophosphatase MutT (NUDIX family)/putative flippase GtrA